MSTNICGKERKVVNLQFATQKEKLPFAALSIAMSSVWYKACLDYPGIRNLLGWGTLCIQRAGPSATLGDLARQRQLDPYGSFLYETLESLFKKSIF